MKKYIKYLILESVSNGPRDAMFLLCAILKAGYGASLSQINYEYEKISSDKNTKETIAEVSRKNKNDYYSLVSHLRHDGLLENENNDNKKRLALKITGKGEVGLETYKIKSGLHYANPYKKTEKINDREPAIVIISFDIPEGERWKRAWIRSALLSMKFKSIQKSVWVGFYKIPQEFTEDIKNLDLVNKVEIFSVNKSGTLRNSL